MSVWIGTIGAMVETACLSGLQVSRPDRTVHGGGPGTLTQPRAVAQGPSSRVWSCTIGVKPPGELAALETLVYRQAVHGGTYRMLACEAHHTNALTPAASLDLTGWTGDRTISTLYTASAEDVGGGTVLLESTPLDARTPIEGGPPVVTVDSVAAITVTPATTGTVLSSPVVPVRPGYPVTVAIFAQGTVTLSVQWVDAAGANLGAAVTLVTTTNAALARTNMSTIAPAGAYGARIVVSGGTRYAWPSITWTPGPRRFAVGRGAESVVLSPVDESLLVAHATAQLSGFRYVVREVPA
ncbi:hypothetical protein [Ornithinimicrobium cerasi]|uniref:hypothetical protein n=1 Tax=Ornithinimicrobium cerasi TaxID=2248773 RepID=UPI00137A9B30|nr:hypothetical protein [Ornithinimicrobium cerasi]